MATQVDLNPSATPGIHFHSPVGRSAGEVNNPSSFPAPSPKAVANAVAKTVAGVKFANPS